MKLTLRQAHKVAEKIVARMATLQLTATKEVNVWQLADNALETLEAEFNTNLTRHLDLVEARQQVRNKIAVANTVAVDKLVSERKATLDLLGTYRSIISSAAGYHINTQTALNDKAASVRSAKGAQSTWGGGDTVTVSVLGADKVQDMQVKVDQLQLHLEQIEDKLTAANSSHSNLIELSENVVKLLKAEGIVTY